MDKLLRANEGAMDRGLRIVIGLGLLALAGTGQTNWGLLGIVPLLTGVLGSCPLYSVLGVSTCPVKKQST